MTTLETLERKAREKAAAMKGNAERRKYNAEAAREWARLQEEARTATEPEIRRALEAVRFDPSRPMPESFPEEATAEAVLMGSWAPIHGARAWVHHWGL